MKCFLPLFFCLCIISTVRAQEEVLSFTEDNSERRSSDGYSFSNKKTGDLALLLVESKGVLAHLFDSTFQEKTSFETEPLRNKYSEIIGYRVSGNTYTVVSTNKSKKKYAVQVFDFNAKKATIDELKFDFDKEKFLETVHYNNQLYLITANKENTFILRKLNSDNQFSEIKRFAIEAEERDQKLLKSGFFTVGLFGGTIANVAKVDNRVPNAIEQTAQPNKLYQKDNLIYLTLENDDALKTTLHIINLETLSLSTKVYDYPKGKKDDLKAHNSFILDNHIIQLGSSRDEMVMQIKDFKGSLIKEHYIDREKPIAIKNSPIIQEGQTALPFVNRREMEETSKFLRKVTSGKLGVTAYKNNNEYFFTIGGYKIVQSGGGMMMMPGGGFSNAGGTVSPTGTFAPTYNPTYYSFNSYTSSKSTFFNTHFDTDFNYVDKEEEANIFERIKEFKKEVKYDTAEDVFFHQGSLYFGYFDGKAKQYHLYKM
ncbi:hypothetical protein [Rasiella sp. SM2506]|uniref:hypothetical protein n=1 Tax=Rasiella sp. SM2506 TaxID=3423914 RepID=UPI003D7981CB